VALLSWVSYLCPRSPSLACPVAPYILCWALGAYILAIDKGEKHLVWPATKNLEVYSFSLSISGPFLIFWNLCVFALGALFPYGI